MYQYYNANPLQRRINDCTVRAISLATNRSWDEVYEELSHYARRLAVMPDDVDYIDGYLKANFPMACDCRKDFITVGEFCKDNPKGNYLITMRGHITCCIDGIIYDTFDPSDRFIWEAYKVK